MFFYPPEGDLGAFRQSDVAFPSQKVHADLLEATAMVAHLAQVIYGNKNAEEEEWEPVDLVAGI